MGMQRGRSWLIRQARVAAALGHQLELENRDRSAEFPDQGQAAVKWWAVCSCGWRSTVRATRATALGVGFYHVGQVVGDQEEAVRNGSFAAPDTPAEITPSKIAGL